MTRRRRAESTGTLADFGEGERCEVLVGDEWVRIRIAWWYGPPPVTGASVCRSCGIDDLDEVFPGRELWGKHETMLASTPARESR